MINSDEYMQVKRSPSDAMELTYQEIIRTSGAMSHPTRVVSTGCRLGVIILGMAFAILPVRADSGDISKEREERAQAEAQYVEERSKA